MTKIEQVFFYITIVLYSLSILSLILYYLNNKFLYSFKSILTNFWWYFYVLAFVTHTLLIIIRWYLSGHPPVYWTYEHALASSWFAAFIFFGAVYITKPLKVLNFLITPFVLIVLIYGYQTGFTYIEGLPVAYQSNWMWIHATFAWMAYSSFAFSFFISIIYILKFKAIGPAKFLNLFPELDVLDLTIFRIIIFGFISLTIEMGAGAIWAYDLWGRYWGWDPMETWTLISWIAYVLYLHLRTTMGWKGVRSAWISILAFIFIFIAFGGIAMMKDLHKPLL